MKTLSLILLLAVAGCVSTSEVVPVGKDTYMVGTQVQGGMESWTEIKARSIKSANDYCDKRGQTMTLQGDVKTSGVRGWTPQNAEVTFKCEPK
jgi:hypothetical protein